MKIDEFQEFTTLLAKLTPSQRKHLVNELKSQSARAESHQIVEARVGDKPVCPHCAQAHAVKFGVCDGLQRYRCKDCRKTFNALTGTPLARLRHKDKWLDYAKPMQVGLSIRKSASECGVHRTTSFRWRHRFLTLPENQQAKLLSGIVEADETFFLNSKKGSCDLDRKPRKRGGKAQKRDLSKEQVCVLVARDRNGATIDAIMPQFTSETLKQTLSSVLDKDIMLCSDGIAVYSTFAKETDIAHKALNMSAGIRVIDKVFHIQNVNAYHSRLKEWTRRFHRVATKYLPNYLGWRRMIERNQALSPSPQAILAAALGMRHQYLIRT